MEHLFLKVYGRVQGVFFRMETKEKAQQLGINGWVKNNHDGSVWIEAEGKKGKLKDLLVWCYKGVASSKVERIDDEWSTKLKGYDKFEIIK